MSFLSGLPVVGGLFDHSDDDAINQLKQNQALFGNLALPQFADYKPEQYSVVGQYDPEKAQANTISEDPSVKTAQMNALNQLAGLSQTGLSDVDQAGYEKARQIGEQAAHSGLAAAMQNAQARGVGGSGLEFAMREMANQDAAGKAQDAALQQASDSARQRALYTQAFGNMAGNVRGQDFNANSANAGILNNFNMYNTGNANQAQQYNLNNAQGIANQNVTGANQAQQYNNQMKQQAYQDAYQKASGQAGANTATANGYAAQNAANASERNNNTKIAADALL